MKRVKDLEVGTQFYDPDGDLSVIIPLKEREADYGGKRVKCVFYSTLDDKGEPFVVACAIPSNTKVRLA